MYVVLKIILINKIEFFDIMKCENCGFENKSKAKFCTRCGASLAKSGEIPAKQGGNNTKFLIVGLTALIIVLICAIGYFAITLNDGGTNQAADYSSDAVSGNESTSSVSESSSSSSSAESGEWKLIGSYSGSGSGSQAVSVPAGKIMVKITAYPIKNYATNHLYVSGSNGQSAGVDWGSRSAVASRYDSVTYESSSSETFNIDYYETVSWSVEFYKYEWGVLMFCPKCGKDLPDNVKFCKYCGSEIKNKRTLSHAPASTGDDEKSKNIVIIGLVALIVVLIIVFAAIGTGMFNRDSSSVGSSSQSVIWDSEVQSVSLSSFSVSEAPGLAQAIKNSGGVFSVTYKSLSLS